MPSHDTPSHHDAATAVTSTSTLNSGRVKPDTITSVEAKALPDDVAAAHRAIDREIGAVGDVGGEPHHVGERHAGLGQDRLDVLEAQHRLRLGILRHRVVRRTPSWPEANTMRAGAATSTAWLYCANGARIEAGLSGRFIRGLPVSA